MDTHYNASLVYHHHPGPHPLATAAPPYPHNPHAMSWNSSHSPPNSTSSQDHQMYASMSRSQDHPDYESHTHPHYVQPRHPQTSPSHPHSQPYHSRESARDLSFGTSHIDPTLAQTRLNLARRRDRAPEEGQVEPGPSTTNPDDHYSDRASPLRRSSLRTVYPETTDGSAAQIADGQFSRPQGVFPLTPVSTSYTFYPSHSRSNSGSGSASNARSASPALSVASALTSVSSTTSAQNNAQKYPDNVSGTAPAPAAPRPKHRKQRLYNVDRKKICVYHRDHPNVKQEEIARLFGVERSTISKILKQKMKWLAVPEETPVLLARTRPTKFPILELRLVSWLKECHENKVIFTDALIRDKAKEIARSMEWPEEKFKASSGWVENFKHRHGIRKGIWHGYGQKYTRSIALGGDGRSHIPYFDLNPAPEFPNNRPAFAQPDPAPPPADSHHDMAGMDTDDDDDELGRHEHGVTLQPAWQPSLTSGGVHSLPAEIDHSSVHEVPPIVDPHEPLPTPLPMPAPVPIPIREDGTVARSEEDVTYVVPNLPTYRPDPGIPNIQEVEAAIDKVIVYLTHHPEFISNADRDSLGSIKTALFEHAGRLGH